MEMSKAGQGFTLLVVTDGTPVDPEVAQAWSRAGAVDVAACSRADLLARVTSPSPPDLILVRADDRGADEIIDEIRSASAAVPVVVWPVSPSVRGAVEVVRRGALDYLTSATDPAAIERVLAHVRGRETGGSAAKGESEAEWQGLFGKSPGMRQLFRQIEAVAPTDATVLIQGETGTGKEHVARLIHRLSPRGGKPFIVCNCSAIVATLAESELFGHEKGAFTGARRAKAGLFEAARGGALFLDQIQELSLTLQPKLLRVLENREFTRVGGGRPMPTDVRVIAAANRDLVEEVREKRFREDLYYRLNTATLTVPPLRDRKEDLPLLVKRFLEEFSPKLGRPTRMISRDAMSELMTLPWEGNVRELRNMIERAVAVSRRRILTTKELGLRRRVRVAPPAAKTLTPAELLSLDELERHQIRRVLDMTGGNRERACKVLGLSRSTLYRRLSELGIRS